MGCGLGASQVPRSAIALFLRTDQWGKLKHTHLHRSSAHQDLKVYVYNVFNHCEEISSSRDGNSYRFAEDDCTTASAGKSSGASSGVSSCAIAGKSAPASNTRAWAAIHPE